MTVVNALGLKNIIIYLVVINIIAFLSMWNDKRKAKSGSWRTPESTLMSLVLLGGGIGGIVGMYVFRHKTKKPKFFLGFPIILIVEIVLSAYILIRY